MIYGPSFLPSIPARWQVTNGQITSTNITLQPGGVASVNLLKEDTLTVPRNLKLTIVANTYTNKFNPTDVVILDIVDEEEIRHQIFCPIIDMGKGIYVLEFEAPEVNYYEFTFSIKSELGIHITTWQLSASLEGATAEALAEIRGEIPSLLYYYNTRRFNVGQKEVSIGQIAARLLENTSMNGHVQVTYTATDNAVLIIRAKDNDVSELFTPILYNISAGRGSIGIPHAYLEKAVGIHNFVITAQVTQGSLYFDVRSILYTIDGGHLAERLMHIGLNISDIALKRVKGERNPSELYAIGIDDDEAVVRFRQFNDNPNASWEPYKILGLATEAAIEFDGTWQKSLDSYLFSTEVHPWCFWVDLDGILWAQIENNKRQLAENVIKITVVKGYSNTSFPANDQGLVLAYIKVDGLAYYRNYCWLNEEEKLWETERNIEEFTGEAVNISSFRTNDYRIGINIEDINGITTTLLTERNWAGIAIQSENIQVGIGGSVELIKIDKIPVHIDVERIEVGIDGDIKLLWGASYNAIVSAENEPITMLDEFDEPYENWGFRVRVKFEHPLLDLEYTEFSLKDSTHATFVMMGVEEISPKEYLFSTADFNNAIDDITIIFAGSGTTIGEAGQNVSSFSGTFTPTNLVPLDIPLPEVEEMWNE